MRYATCRRFALVLLSATVVLILSARMGSAQEPLPDAYVWCIINQEVDDELFEGTMDFSLPYDEKDRPHEWHERHGLMGEVGDWKFTIGETEIKARAKYANGPRLTRHVPPTPGMDDFSPQHAVWMSGKTFATGHGGLLSDDYPTKVMNNASAGARTYARFYPDPNNPPLVPVDQIPVSVRGCLTVAMTNYVAGPSGYIEPLGYSGHVAASMTANDFHGGLLDEFGPPQFKINVEDVPTNNQWEGKSTGNIPLPWLNFTWPPEEVFSVGIKVEAQTKFEGIFPSAMPGLWDTARGTMEFTAFADPVIEIDPSFPYKDNFILEMSPNMGNWAPEVSYSNFHRAVVNNAGQVGYNATALIGGESLTVAYVGDNQEHRPLAYSGMIMPDGPMPWLGGAIIRRINNRGEAILKGSVEGFGSSSECILSGSGDELRMVAAVGDPAPGTADGVVFGSTDVHAPMSHPLLGDGGHVLFGAIVKGTDVNHFNRFGLWVGKPGEVELLARRYDPIPGVPSHWEAVFDEGGGTFSPITDRGAAINAGGEVIFHSKIKGKYPYIQPKNDTAIWLGKPGDLTMVAREGKDLAGVRPGSSIFYDSFYKGFGLNDAGQIAFSCKLRGTGTNGATFAIVAGDPDDLQLVMRRNDDAPGCPGLRFGFERPGSLVLNGSGQIAFRNMLAGEGLTNENNEGLWFGAPGDLRLIIREGDQAPGTEEGVVFGDISMSGKPVAMNDWGVAFMTNLAGLDVVIGENDRGIWAMDLAGDLQLIVRTGGLFDVGEGEMKTISQLDFLHESGGEDGYGVSFNDLGQVAFTATFTDGTSDFFLSNAVAVPEPSGLMLLATGVLGALARARRKSGINLKMY